MITRNKAARIAATSPSSTTSSSTRSSKNGNTSSTPAAAAAAAPAMAGKPPRAGPKSLRVLCFGDSLTAGYWGRGSMYRPYAEVLEERLADAFPELALTVLENGMPGDIACASPFVKRLQSECEHPSFSSSLFLSKFCWEFTVQLAVFLLTR